MRSCIMRKFSRRNPGCLCVGDFVTLLVLMFLVRFLFTFPHLIFVPLIVISVAVTFSIQVSMTQAYLRGQKGTQNLRAQVLLS